MNFPRLAALGRCFALAVLCPVAWANFVEVGKAPPPSTYPFAADPTARPKPADYDFSPVAEPVVRLLQSGDVAEFVKTMAPSVDDMGSLLSTKRETMGTEEDPLGPELEKSLERGRRKLEANARRLLAKAAELKVDFSGMRLRGTVVAPEALSGRGFGGFMGEREYLVCAETLLIRVTAEPLSGGASTGASPREYTLALDEVIKFPTGWRCDNGVRWFSFPEGVADENTQAEMRVLHIAAKLGARLSGAEDPALIKLGEDLARFIRERDLARYDAEVGMNVDALWEMARRQSPRLPPREAVEPRWKAHLTEVNAPARQVIARLERFGVDLGQAEIEVQAVTFDRLYARYGSGMADGLEGKQLRVVLAVRSEGKSLTGRPLGGQYVLAAEEATRVGGRWVISENLHWEKLPEGVADEAAAAALAFEDHVARHGTLPVGTPAPDIEFVGIHDGQKGRFADLRGKVVILDFWSTTCGPCQEPLAKMQKYREENPGWGDRVAIVTLSIDDTLPMARAHLEKRGWTTTLNLWAGEGGWKSGPAKAFRVTAIPTCYVIDAQGKVAAADHFLDAPEVVNRLLK